MRGSSGPTRSTKGREFSMGWKETASSRPRTASIYSRPLCPDPKTKLCKTFKKLTSLARKLPSKIQYKAVKCWFVTRTEPTADQREVANKHHGLVNALSFTQFQSRLIDAASYLNLRDNYAFGSVRDPATGSAQSPIEYVPLDLMQIGPTKLWSVTEIRDAILNGDRFVVFGDYGAGKSMTLRELYRTLRRAYFKQRTPEFPLYINLRDHFGQTNPAEVLERHGRNLGFPILRTLYGRGGQDTPYY